MDSTQSGMTEVEGMVEEGTHEQLSVLADLQLVLVGGGIGDTVI